MFNLFCKADGLLSRALDAGRRLWGASAPTFGPSGPAGESFEFLFQSNPVPMWVHEQGSYRFLAVNPAALVKFGYSRQQFEAMTLLELRSEEDRKAPLIYTLADGVRSRIGRYRRADGTLVDVSIYARDIDHAGVKAVLVAAIDISAQVSAEAELRRARAFLDTIFDEVPVSVFVKDMRSDRYVLVNRAAEQLLGVPRAHIIGQRPEDLDLGPEAEAARTRDLAQLRAGTKMVASEYDLQTKAGTTRHVSVRRVLVNEGETEASHLVTVLDDLTDLRAAHQRIAFLDRHDPLTGLRNRGAFMADLERLLNERAPQARPVMLVSLDICDFTEVNDLAGPAAGDEILKAVASYVKEEDDIALMGRVGGDEFMVALTATPRAAADFAHRLNDVVRRCGSAFQEGISLGIDAGIAVFPTDGADAITLMANAEAAQHRAQAQPSQRVCFFEAAVDQRLRDQRRLHRELERAIRQKEFLPFYQPQARIDGTIYGVEALLRWQHPQTGMISPAHFIPAAEESGQIIEIGEMLLRQVCREAMTWEMPLNLAVNLSPAQFEQADFPGLVAEILSETGLAPERLEVEITEGMLIGDNRRALRILRELKALGLRIAMDDFGTGYSSLAYLQAFPFDRLKIDRRFVSDLEASPQSAAIVKAVIGLGHGLGLPVLAEGVERHEQWQALRQLGCDEVQGFLIGRPNRAVPTMTWRDPEERLRVAG